MKKSKLFSLILILSIILWIISFSIAVPILFRPFYYLHIYLLNLVEETGYDLVTIKTAYNEMLDFCIGVSDTFSTGALKFTESGMSHFADCKVLFQLDFVVLAVTTSILIISFILIKKKKAEPYHFNHHRCTYYSGLLTLVSFTIIAFFAALDFDAAFVVFHHLFFPGKDNWLFDPRKDQIINILPEQFFANCAILIVVLMFGISIALMVHDKKKAAL